MVHSEVGYSFSWNAHQFEENQDFLYTEVADVSIRGYGHIG